MSAGMFTYAFLRPRERKGVWASAIHKLGNQLVGGAIAAVTTAGDSDPCVVFVRCTRELTAGERQALAELCENCPPSD